MISITKNLKIFSILFFLYTIIFRYLLSHSITNNEPTLKWIAAIIYGILIFITAFMLGKSENISTGVIYVGFKYHLFSYIIFNLIALLWYAMKFSSKYENINFVLIVIGIWGAIVLLHFIFTLLSSKSAVKGIPKEDIFE